jgi:hypothetical protein
MNDSHITITAMDNADFVQAIAEARRTIDAFAISLAGALTSGPTIQFATPPVVRAIRLRE